jgi:hypothetical protein
VNNNPLLYRLEALYALSIPAARCEGNSAVTIDPVILFAAEDPAEGIPVFLFTNDVKSSMTEIFILIPYASDINGLISVR